MKSVYQSAHGDREFGFICSRMSINRKDAYYGQGKR